MTIPAVLHHCVAIRLKWEVLGNSLVVLWSGLHAFTAKGTGSPPGGGSKIPQAMRGGQEKKKGGIITLW